MHTNYPQGKTTKQIPSPDRDQRLTVQEVAALAGIGVSTVWKFVTEKRLPAPQRYGKRCTRWRRGAVLDALDNGTAV